jgi:N-acetylneuraminate synthase
MTDIPSLRKIAQLGKPMIVSTGMSTFEEIDRTYEVLAATGVPLALMNCVSEYPPQYQDINLKVIGTMISRYPKAIIGHSDHTPDLFTCYAAVALGAKIIEKHVILDKLQPGPDQAVSIDFNELSVLVGGIRKIEAAMGEERSVHHKEKQIREWAFRSLVSTCDIKAGDTITDEMVWTKRPGTGIPSAEMPKIIGLRAKRSVPANTLFAWEDFEEVR